MSEVRRDRAEAEGVNLAMNPTASIKTVKDLKVYEKAYTLSMEIFQCTKQFPKEETYSLTDQIRRSSRSVSINIREGYAKRRYKPVFIRHLNDALGSAEETRGWLKYALDCKYVARECYERLENEYDEVSAMLFSLINNWESR